MYKLDLALSNCDTMGGICFSVCMCQSENPFVYFSAERTQKACARDLPPDRKDEGMKVREKTEQGGQQKVAEEDSRHEGQSRDESRTEWRPVNGSQKSACQDLLTHR